MYRALIVDDEPIACDSIEYIIKNNISQIEIVGKARSGRDAIEKAYISHPDIVLMDINLPGINGLEALKHIKKENPDVIMIVTTAFDYFDYARESVNLNVAEYLLKPIREEKLVDTLNKVISDINSKRDKIRQEIELKEKFEIVVPMLETGFINSICIFNSNAEELNNYCHMFGYQDTTGYILAIEFGEKTGGEVINKIGVGIKSQNRYGEYKDILKSVCKCAIGPVMLNRIIVYVFDNSSDDKFEQKTSAIKVAKAFLDRASRINISISIGLGSTSDVADAKLSYREAIHSLQVLLKNEDCNILHCDDIIEDYEDSLLDIEQKLEKTVYASALNGDVNETILAFNNFFGQLSTEKPGDFDIIKNVCVAIIVGFGKRWSFSLKNCTVVLSSIINSESIDELMDISIKFIRETVGQIASTKQKRINSIIEKADSFIFANYSSEISLEDIAKEVNLSPFYFSHFYKEETGLSFIDRLISFRIDKAKELLSQSDFSIKDVSHSVGYSDPNYFSKLFKKVVGITASEYKEQYGGI